MSTETKKPSVLLVEDSEDDAFLFTWKFRQSGVDCSLHHVLDGAAAVEFLRQSSAMDDPALPRIIFLDLKMPVMNGFEVLGWLREQDFCHELRVVILSGSDQENDRERAFQLGASDYLVKPVLASDIQRLLGDLCPPRTGSYSKGIKAPT
jgi:chemotaxis family two-component system response regulator Rcp1